MKPGHAPSGRRETAGRRRRGLLGLTGAVIAAALVISACSSSSSQAPSSGATVKGGVATYGFVSGQSPTYIWPFIPIADESVPNGQNFQYMLYRPLYMFGNNGTSVQVNYPLSPANAPVYSDGGKTVTVQLKGWKWSDGEAVDAQDVAFWLNMMKAEKANYAGYTPGTLPDNLGVHLGHRPGHDRPAPDQDLRVDVVHLQPAGRDHADAARLGRDLSGRQARQRRVPHQHLRLRESVELPDRAGQGHLHVRDERPLGRCGRPMEADGVQRQRPRRFRSQQGLLGFAEADALRAQVPRLHQRHRHVHGAEDGLAGRGRGTAGRPPGEAAEPGAAVVQPARVRVRAAAVLHLCDRLHPAQLQEPNRRAGAQAAVLPPGADVRQRPGRHLEGDLPRLRVPHDRAGSSRARQRLRARGGKGQRRGGRLPLQHRQGEERAGKPRLEDGRAAS